MHAPTVLTKCGGRTNLSVGFAASSPWEGEPDWVRTSDARPYGSDEVRWGTNLSVGFADSSPWEGEPRGVDE